MFPTHRVLQRRLLPDQWRHKEAGGPPHPSGQRRATGRPGPGCGPGWMPGQQRQRTCRAAAAARWWRPLRSHPHCATGGEEKTENEEWGGLKKRWDQLISQPKKMCDCPRRSILSKARKTQRGETIRSGAPAPCDRSSHLSVIATHLSWYLSATFGRFSSPSFQRWQPCYVSRRAQYNLFLFAGLKCCPERATFHLTLFLNVIFKIDQVGWLRPHRWLLLQCRMQQVARKKPFIVFYKVGIFWS